jgi:hypothetical protein
VSFPVPFRAAPLASLVCVLGGTAHGQRRGVAGSARTQHLASRRYYADQAYGPERLRSDESHESPTSGVRARPPGGWPRPAGQSRRETGRNRPTRPALPLHPTPPYPAATERAGPP